jgi:large subunit ribosomal protein L43
VIRYRKNQHTDYPTIQGVWTPFTNQPPEMNLAEFPYTELSEPKDKIPTATEQLLEIFKQSQVKDVPPK